MKQQAVDYALSLSRKYDLYLFPAIWAKDKKTKKFQHQGLCKWGTEASNDPNKIKAWGTMHPENTYFCIHLRKSNLCVIDVDIKEKKDGLNTLDTLTMLHGPLPDTLISQTPSGGYHYVYSGSAKFGANRLGSGIDIAVMIPLPGSTVEGKGDYKVIHNSPITTLPEWVVNLAGEPHEIEPQKEQPPLIELDQEPNINRAIAFLKDVEPAVEGNGGNDHTYKVLCAVKEMGISEGICLDLSAQHFNCRCIPPWSFEELKRINQNAFKYSVSSPGVTDATQDFEPVTPKNLIQFLPFSELTEKLIPPKWLVKHYFERDTITLLYGDSGAYKSFIAMDIGLHIASSKDWLGKKTVYGSVFYLAGEGHGGIRRRLLAWKMVHLSERRKLPFYTSPYAIQLDQPSNIKLLLQSIQVLDETPALLIIDTLATSFGNGDENSAKDMSKFLLYCQKLREVLHCAIIIVHHTGHKEKERPRGSYALMAGVDAFYNIERPESKEITCLRSPGKMKDGVPQPDTWFKSIRIRLGIDEDLEDVTSLIMEYMPNYKEPVNTTVGLGKNELILLSLAREHTGLTDLKKAFQDKKEADGEPFHKNYLYSAIKTLVNKHLLSVENGSVKILSGIIDEEGGF